LHSDFCKILCQQFGSKNIQRCTTYVRLDAIAPSLAKIFSRILDFCQKHDFLDRVWGIYKLFEIEARNKCKEEDEGCYDYIMDKVSKNSLAVVKKYDPSRSSERTYINNFLDSKIVDYYRSQNVLNRILPKEWCEHEDKEYHDVLTQLLKEDDSNKIADVVQRLKDRDKISCEEILIYHYIIDDVSDQTIAQLLNINLKRVHSLKHNFVQKVQREYQKVYPS